MRRPDLLLIIGAVLASAAVGLGLVLAERRVLQLAVLVLGISGIAMAFVGRRPFLAAAVVSIVFCPIYASRAVGPLLGEPTLLVMAALVAASVVAMALGQRVSGGWTYLDGLVACFVVITIVPAVLGVRSVTEYVQALWVSVIPYLAGRLAVRDTDDLQFVTRWLVWAALASIPLLLLEFATESSPFWRLAYNPGSSEVWAEGIRRFGLPRVEGAFGHPIALSMVFCAIALVAFVYAMSDKTRAGWFWLGAAVTLVVVQCMSLSRNGFLVLAAASPLVLLVVLGRIRVTRAIAAFTSLAAVAAILLTATPAGELFSQQDTTLEVQRSSSYRSGLVEKALSSGVLLPWGSTSSRVSRQVEAGNASIDNEYVFRADRWGYLPAALLALLAASPLIGVLLLWRRSPLAAGWAAASVAMGVALLTVALITQMELFYWFMLGSVGAALAAARRERGQMSGAEA